jgi:dihydroorotate dehydrogenase (fumarate)
MPLARQVDAAGAERTIPRAEEDEGCSGQEDRPMSDFTTEYLGLTLRSPLVASSSPLTGELDGLRRLEDAGTAAVVLPSLFEEEITFESSGRDRPPETGAQVLGGALSYFPEFEKYNTGPDSYLELVADAKRALAIPVIASLNGASPGEWLDHARLIEEAGADALELNVFFVASDPDTTADAVETSHCELVRSARRAVKIPLAVKIGPYFSAFAHMARKLVEAGADGLVLFNRFYQPDLDLVGLEASPRLTLSTSEDVRLALRWMGILHGEFRASLAASSGVHTAVDALKLVLAGADVAMMASALLQWGPRHVARVERDILEWMEEHEYASVRQIRGSVSRRAIADPSAFERGSYMRALKTYSISFRA